MKDKATLESYEIISNWLYGWEKLVEKPRELLFDRSFVNVARAAALALEDHFHNKPEKKIQRSAQGWGRKLLGLLEDSYRERDPYIDLLRLEHRTEVEEMERQLKANEFDVKAIYPLLNTIKEGLSLPPIQQEFTKEVLLGAGADLYRLHALSEFLLRNVLTKHGVSVLKEMPQKSLARHGSKLILNKHVAALAESEVLNRGLYGGWLDFLIEETSPDKIELLFSEEPVSLFDLFKRYLWRYLTHQFIAEVARLCGDELKRLSSYESMSAILMELESDSERHQRLGFELTRLYTKIFLRYVIATVVAKPAREENSKLDLLSRPLGDYLIKVAGFVDNRSRPDGHRPNIVDLLLTEALGIAFSKLLSEQLADKFMSDEVKATAEVLGRRLCVHLSSEIKTVELNWGSMSPDEIESLCSNWSARHTLHRELGHHLRSLSKHLAGHVAQALRDHQAVEQTMSRDDRLRFWNEWKESFVQKAGLESHVLHYFPWETLSTPELGELINNALGDFVRPQGEWLTIFMVKDLDATGKIWTISDVTFYDSKTFDFGEKRWFPDEIQETVTFAKLIVRAETPVVAKQQAWNRLHEVLNGFAFALSADQQWGGFRPEVHPDIYVEEVSTGNWTAGWSVTRTDRPIIQHLENLRHFESTFKNLLTTSRDPSGLNGLQENLLQALHWYCKGRWERDAAETFIFYWIGLERLFGESQERLFELMSQLSVTWRNVYKEGWYFLSRHEDAVLKKIESDEELRELVDAHPELKGWNSDVRVLLNHKNVALLLSIIPDIKSETKSYVEGYRDYLQKFVDARDATVQEIELLRSHFRFKLLLLKDLRNRMAHQALYYRPDVILFADELEDIFEDVLVKISNDAIQDLPRCDSMKDLIDKYGELWVS